MNPQLQNSYSYAGNNPINGKDPSGRCMTGNGFSTQACQGLFVGYGEGLVSQATGIYSLLTTNPVTSAKNIYSGIQNIPQSLQDFYSYMNDPNVSDYDKARVSGQVAINLALLKGASELGAANLTRSAAARSGTWTYGAFKSEAKWANQFEARGWTPELVTDTVQNGKSYKATNMVNPGNGATRYENKNTGQSVVVDNKTNELLHVGGKGFKY